MANLIPDHRLDKKVVETDVKFLLSLGNINAKTGMMIEDPKSLLSQGYDTVCVTAGLWKPIELGIQNETSPPAWWIYSPTHPHIHLSGRVAVIGAAPRLWIVPLPRTQRAAHVELFMLEKLSEMPLTFKERTEMLDFDIEVNSRIRVNKILAESERISGLETVKMDLPDGARFSPANVREIVGTQGTRTGFSAVVIAIGMRPGLPRGDQAEGLFYAGDFITGPKTVVEATASGKNSAVEIDAWLQKKEKARDQEAEQILLQPTRLPTCTGFA